LQKEEREQYIEIIFQSSNQLLSIINDIVDIANVESGQVKVNLVEMNLNSDLRVLNEQFRIKEKQGNVQIYLKEGLSDNEAMIVTDKTKLIQVLSNLINNSVKFTRKGQIDFGYIQKNRILEFYVKDTGIGIPHEKLDKIFDRFYQVDGTGSRQYGGTGLGLSLCKAYVELLGGNITVESVPDKGSKFIFTIPYRQG
jgi:signal transduction histidine kinase